MLHKSKAAELTLCGLVILFRGARTLYRYAYCPSPVSKPQRKPPLLRSRQVPAVDKEFNSTSSVTLR